jgi:hypothetical protein
MSLSFDLNLHLILNQTLTEPEISLKRVLIPSLGLSLKTNLQDPDLITESSPKPELSPKLN